MEHQHATHPYLRLSHTLRWGGAAFALASATGCFGQALSAGLWNIRNQADSPKLDATIQFCLPARDIPEKSVAWAGLMDRGNCQTLVRSASALSVACTTQGGSWTFTRVHNSSALVTSQITGTQVADGKVKTLYDMQTSEQWVDADCHGLKVTEPSTLYAPITR